MKGRCAGLLLLSLMVALSVLFVVPRDAQQADAGALVETASRPAGASAVRPIEGLLDLSFDPGTGADAGVDTVVLQANGKIMIGGAFTLYNGTARRNIARLNANGSLDTSFNPGDGPNPGCRVYAIAVQPDGKILIAGYFNTYGEISREGIARLNSDGSLDTSFSPGDGVNGTVFAMLLQSDGKILIGGSFSEYNSIARNNIARVNADGSLDTSFDPGAGADNRVHSLAVQPADGKVLIGGYFNAFNSQVRHHLARLSAAGALDTTFDPGVVENEFAIIYAVVIQPDGKILVGGTFSKYNGVNRSGIARANANGSIDTTFDPGSGADDSVLALVLQPDGRILLAGGFQFYNSTTRSYIARVLSSGELDASFDPGAGTDNLVDVMVRQPNGQVVIGGTFSEYDNVSRNAVARVITQAYRVYLPMARR